MRRLKEFLKSKGFYVALGTGIVAFAALMMVYNYSTTKDELTREQGIDLNQPVAEEDVYDTQQDNAQVADSSDADETAANVDKKAETAGSDGVIKNSDEVSDSETAEDENATDADDDKSVDGAATDEANVEDSENETAQNEADSENSVAATSDGAEADTSDDESLTAGLEYNGEQSLTWPLEGNVIQPYSMDTTVYFQTLDSYKCNPGMMIEGEEGSNVMAAYEGVVTSVEDNKEYGTVVRIDMGNGYEAIYGQLMNVCVSEGDTVTMAENIAEVGPVSSYYTEEGEHLYFAITKDGTPVDPMSLIQ